jgi:hypothetical protein
MNSQHLGKSGRIRIILSPSPRGYDQSGRPGAEEKPSYPSDQRHDIALTSQLAMGHLLCPEPTAWVKIRLKRGEGIGMFIVLRR